MTLERLLETMDPNWNGRLTDRIWRCIRQKSPELIETLGSERQRLSRMGQHERAAGRQGFSRVAGLDEVGRGPMAGPLVAAAVVFKEPPWIVGLNDSKQLLPEQREALCDRIRACAWDWAIGEVSVEEMQRLHLNMHLVNILAMERARDGLRRVRPELLLIDGRFKIRRDDPQLTLVKGDCRSYSIAAASILAKVHRDHIMESLHQRFPQYGFDSHKGYATPDHLRALEAHGPCSEHRPQFRRVQAMLR